MLIQIDDGDENSLESLRNTTGAKDYKELFNNALTMLSWAVEQRRAGREIGSINETEKSYRVLQMNILDRAVAN
jgi:hypothetical protein